MKSFKVFAPYIAFTAVALLLSWLTGTQPAIQHLFTEGPEGLYLTLALIFGVGYSLNLFAPKTVIPSFVWAIFFGMALQPVLILLTHETRSLAVIVELLAALVLFGGGIEVPFQNFKKYIAPIAMISLLGTLLTVILFSFTLERLGIVFGLQIPAGVILLTAAILASIDPTAIIPSLKTLKLKRPFLKDVAIAESAVNDVAGTILTRFILVATLATAAGAGSKTVSDVLLPLLSRDVFDALALEVIWGVIVGVFGAWILKVWSRKVVAQGGENASDPALFFAVPIFAFAMGSVVGGSGFLAAFIAGLLFDVSAPTHSVRHFFETLGDGFIKPVIFILLGAIVPIQVLLETALLGIIAAIMFMFIIRPIVVFISLSPWSLKHRSLFSIQELLFLSFIRETGAIPAVLILVAVSSGIQHSDFIFSIGMWVILLTLLVEPPLTEALAKRLGITKSRKKASAS